MSKARLDQDWRDLLEARGIIEKPTVPTIEKLGEAITARKGVYSFGTGLDKVTRARVGLPADDGMVYGETERVDPATALCGAFVEALRQVPVQATLPGTDRRPMDDQPHIDVTYGDGADDQGDQPQFVDYAELPEASTFEGETWEAPPEPTDFDPAPDHALAWTVGQIPMGVTYVPATTVWEDGDDGEESGLVERPARWLLHAGWTYDVDTGTVYPIAPTAADPDMWAGHYQIMPTNQDRELWMTPAFMPPMVSYDEVPGLAESGDNDRRYWIEHQYDYRSFMDGGDWTAQIVVAATGEVVWKSWTRGEQPADDAALGDGEAVDGETVQGATADDPGTPGANEEAARQAGIIARANAAGYHLTLDPMTRLAIDDGTGASVPWRYLEKNFGNHSDDAADPADVPVIEKPKRKRSRKAKDDAAATANADELARQGLPPKLDTTTAEWTIGIEVTTDEGDEFIAGESDGAVPVEPLKWNGPNDGGETLD